MYSSTGAFVNLWFLPRLDIRDRFGAVNKSAAADTVVKTFIPNLSSSKTPSRQRIVFRPTRHPPNSPPTPSCNDFGTDVDRYRTLTPGEGEGKLCNRTPGGFPKIDRINDGPYNNNTTTPYTLLAITPWAVQEKVNKYWTRIFPRKLLNSNVVQE